MNYYDRLIRSGPTGKLVADIIDALIDDINEIKSTLVAGGQPHKVNDTVNVITTPDVVSGFDGCIELEQEEITDYEAHIGSTTYHDAADTTNVVTEIGVILEIYTLLDELKVDYEAHRVYLTGSCHAGTDAVNTISAANATTKALAVALSNDLRTQYIANFANVTTHHGAEDTVGVAAATAVAVLDGDSTWTEIAAAADALRAAYEAHRVLTAGGVHGGADAANDVTAAAVGTVTTALYAGQNELKADFNAHILESGTSHYFSDVSMEVTAANATTELTSIALANALKVAINDHISLAEETELLPNLRDREEDRLRR
jgi:hypothetical protein